MLGEPTVDVDGGAGHHNRTIRAFDQVRQLSDVRRLYRRGREQRQRRCDYGVIRLLAPVVHGHDHERRTARSDRLVARASHRSRHALSADRLMDGDQVVAGQSGNVSG